MSALTGVSLCLMAFMAWAYVGDKFAVWLDERFSASCGAGLWVFLTFACLAIAGACI